MSGMAFFDREVGEAPVGTPAMREWEKKADKVNKRRTVRKDAVCDFCTKGIGLDKGAEPGKNAPNFWYKPTNLKIWWHKYIGRDMQYNRQVSAAEWVQIFQECLDSLIAHADRRAQKAD